ncbi:MAG TPA: NAD-dependent epimerase/dehydratase family protein [Pedobacter sp.]|jgi:nucleoside-diphosphate-sugar epimerase
MIKTCLITGSTGFIGKNLTPYLNKRNTVCNILSRQELNAVQIKTLNPNDTVIHLAGKAHDVHKHAKPYEYYQVNFDLTKKLFDAFLKSDAEKFIYISSIKAVADECDGILTENTIPEPQTDYGISKLLAEQYIQNQPLPPGKSYYILRPCMTHGPGNKGNLNLLYKLIEKGLPYPLAAFNNMRSFVSVQNLCFIISEIVHRDDIKSDVYHISDDEPLSTAEVVSILASSINRKPNLLKVSPWLINSVAKVGDFFHLPLTSDRLQKMTSSFVVSNYKIKKVLKKQLPIDVRDGIKITASSFNIETEETFQYDQKPVYT